MANKTVVTQVSVADFLATIEDAQQVADSQALCDLMQRVTGCPPVMWGPAIIGFGKYHYVYDSGREGDSMLVGFSPRKGKISVYITQNFEAAPAMLEQLGKHKSAKSCLYIKRLSDVDLAVMEQLVAKTVALRKEQHEVLEG
jgi:hypothetical protein